MRAAVILALSLTFAAAPAPSADAMNRLSPASGDFRDEPCPGGPFLWNGDGTYEGHITWDHHSVVPPTYGAFAECIDAGSTTLCGVFFDLTRDETMPPGTMDVYVWEDAGGAPGDVVTMLPGVSPGDVAVWPEVSRHYVDLDDVPVSGRFWVGYWGAWPGEAAHWYVAVDESDSYGCPMTNIAPGAGLPEGWQECSAVFGAVGALGIGAVTSTLEVFGFHHNPIGQTRCRVDVVDERPVLRVTELGQPGTDGVRIDLEGQVTRQDDFEVASEFDSSSVGGFLRITGRGTLDGQPDQVFMNQRFDVPAPDSLVVSYDLSAQDPVSVTAYIWNYGVFERSVEGLPAQFRAHFKAALERKPKIKIRPTGSLSSADIKIKITFGIVQDPGGGTVLELGPGDYHIVFKTIGPRHTVTDYGTCAMTARMSEITVTEERIVRSPLAAIDEGTTVASGKLQLRCGNPMRASEPFSISYSLDEAGPVRLSLFDPAGRLAAILFDGEKPAGRHATSERPAAAGSRGGLPPGTYLLRLESSEGTASQKVVILP